MTYNYSVQGVKLTLLKNLPSKRARAYGAVFVNVHHDKIDRLFHQFVAI